MFIKGRGLGAEAQVGGKPWKREKAFFPPGKEGRQEREF